MTTRNGNASTQGGLGFVGALTLVFVVLKLCSVIDWPWVWVLAPLWISALSFTALFAAVVAGAVVYVLVSSATPDRPRRAVPHRRRSRYGPVGKWGYRHGVDSHPPAADGDDDERGRHGGTI